jgi:hypothetical protein
MVGDIAADFPGCKFANEAGLILEPDIPLAGLRPILYAVGRESQGSVRIQLFDMEVREVNADLDAPAVGFLDPLCAEMRLDTSGCEVLDDNGPVKPGSVLRDISGVLKYIKPVSSPQPAPLPEFQPAVAEAPAVHIDDIDRKFDPAEPRPSYTFVYGEEVFNLNIPDRATVGDTKEFVSERFKTIAENVKLLHCGKELKDMLIISKQRIGPGNRILVYIREMSSIILQSCGPAPGWLRTAEKPPDYLDQLRRLAEESGQDPRICARAFTYFNYDYRKALNELQELDN